MGNHIKITVICKVHGEFLQRPSDHWGGQGCLKCYDDRRSTLQRSTSPEFIEKANLTHNNFYDYSKCHYINNHVKIAIICPSHGNFLQTPSDHLGGHGCPSCGKQTSISTHAYDLKEFVERSNALYHNKYDYSKFVYRNANTKGIIVCKLHGEFLQKPYSHLALHGCPICNSSKGELKIHSHLINSGINFIHQKSFDDCKNSNTGRKFKFDFYIPSKSLLIEYDGYQHFKSGACMRGKFFLTQKELKETKYRDKIKTQYAKRNGFRLLRIKYTQFSKIDEILASALK